MKILQFIFLFIILLTQFCFGQEAGQKFSVDFSEIKGELTLKDLFKKDFGRYDGYEIDLFENEAVNFVVYTNYFNPSLAFVDPKREIYKQNVGAGKGYANIITTVPTSGTWILYVIGDESSTGSYLLQTAIAEPNALTLSDDADFCATLDFLLAHANAYFFLLENPVLQKQQLVKLNNSTDAYFDEETGSYNATYYDGNDLKKAEALFKSISEKIKTCIGKNWTEKYSNWQKVENYKVKSITFTEKVKEKPRFITVSIYDFAGSGQNIQSLFKVEVSINRKQ